METYRLETTVTKDGKIILPRSFAKMFSHRVEIMIKDKSPKNSKTELNIPAFNCGGKVMETDFGREELYDYRF